MMNKKTIVKIVFLVVLLAVLLVTPLNVKNTYKILVNSTKYSNDLQGLVAEQVKLKSIYTSKLTAFRATKTNFDSANLKELMESISTIPDIKSVSLSAAFYENGIYKAGTKINDTRHIISSDYYTIDIACKNVATTLTALENFSIFYECVQFSNKTNIINIIIKQR